MPLLDESKLPYSFVSRLLFQEKIQHVLQLNYTLYFRYIYERRNFRISQTF